MVWFVHVLIVKWWTLQERWLPFPSLVKQSQNMHFQSSVQKSGTWARAGCCNNTQQGDTHAEVGRSAINDVLAGTLTPWCFWLAPNSSNPSWLWASTVCISARPRVLWTKCFWMNDPRASWEYLCYSKHYFAYPKCWSSLLQYDFNQEGHWGFLSPGPSNGLINGEFSFHL